MTKDTKTALLDVAESLVRARGFDGFSYADLAQAVGIRKASIHHHFPTKAGLSEALIDRYASTVATACDEISKAHGTASARLLGLIAFYRRALHQGETLCLCVSLLNSRESLSDAANAKVTGFRAQMLAWIKAVFQQGQADQTITGIVDAQAEAHAALALLEGAHLAGRAEGDPQAFDLAVAGLIARC